MTRLSLGFTYSRLSHAQVIQSIDGGGNDVAARIGVMLKDDTAEKLNKIQDAFKQIETPEDLEVVDRDAAARLAAIVRPGGAQGAVPRDRDIT
jgi:hypothetical protein